MGTKGSKATEMNPKWSEMDGKCLKQHHGSREDRLHKPTIIGGHALVVKSAVIWKKPALGSCHIMNTGVIVNGGMGKHKKCCEVR